MLRLAVVALLADPALMKCVAVAAGDTPRGLRPAAYAVARMRWPDAPKPYNAWQMPRYRRRLVLVHDAARPGLAGAGSPYHHMS